MRVLSALSLLLVVLLPWPSRAGLLSYERHELDNGLEVILHEDDTLPLVAVDLSYHVGSMHDGTHPGRAHLVEHLMFRGTRHLGDGEGDRLLSEAGAVGTNAATLPDHTTYHTLIPREALPLALWIESDRMAHLSPVLDDGRIEQEVQTVVDEWEFRVQSERHGLDRDALWSALFPTGHPFRPVQPRQLRRLGLTDARHHVGRFHGPRNATLVLAGDLPPDALDQVRAAFGHRKGGERPSPPPNLAVEPRAEQRIERTAELGTTTTVAIAWPSPGLYEPGDAEADVLMATLEAGLLRERMETHLPDALLSTDAAQISRVGQSLFLLVAEGTASTEPQALLEALDATLDELRSRSLTPTEIQRASKRFVTDTLRSLQRIDGRARQLQRYVAAGKDPGWIEEDLARYEAVDAAAVARFVETTLDPRRRVVLLSRPSGTKQ